MFIGSQLVAALLEKKGDGICEIAVIAVKTVYRRQGIGKMLMHTYLSNRQACHVQLHISFVIALNIISFPSPHVSTINDEAIQFYQALGFTITSTIPIYYSQLDHPEAYRMVYNKPRV